MSPLAVKNISSGPGLKLQSFNNEQIYQNYGTLQSKGMPSYDIQHFRAFETMTTYFYVPGVVTVVGDCVVGGNVVGLGVVVVFTVEKVVDVIVVLCEGFVSFVLGDGVPAIINKSKKKT